MHPHTYVLCKLLLSYFSACPAGFELFYGQGCILVVTDTPASHDDAKAACQAANPNSHLLEPRSSSRQQQLASLMAKHASLGSHGMHVGITKNTDGQWIYSSDETPVFVMCK